MDRNNGINLKHAPLKIEVCENQLEDLYNYLRPLDDKTRVSTLFSMFDFYKKYSGMVNMKLDLSFTKFIIKPLIATAMMAICSYAAYIVFNCIIAEKVATIIAILVAILIYTFTIFILKIFTKEEIYMIPYGQKLYKILKKVKIYKEDENTVK